jgi:hypothetical protein
LEELLVERLLLCWLQTVCADAWAVRHRDDSPAQFEVHQRAQNRAHDRLLSAAKALATLRKLESRSPSPLELVGRPVNETPAVGAGARRAAVLAG